MILVYTEIREGKIKKASLEALSEAKRRAREIETEVKAVLAGENVEGLCSQLFSYGASQVYVLDSPLLSNYSSSGYTQALYSLVEEVNPQIIFFPATAMGQDLAPRLAAKLGVSLATDCIHTEIKDGRLEVIRPIFAGKAYATVNLKSSPQMATLRPNVFPAEGGEETKGEVINKEVSLSQEQIKERVEEEHREKGEEIDVGEAQIIVSGGRGMKGPENFGMLRELTSLLPHSAVGASRAAVDAGWIDHQHQVGQTGKTVSPVLYVAVGISGAIQHLAGMSSSKYIVAINKDPEAPIFKVADLGVVGDLFKVIPSLKEELKKQLGD